jgi:hypothetical protein
MVSPLQETQPPVLVGIDRLVVYAAREVQLLAALTPIQAHRERARLTAELRAGRLSLPNWNYAPVCHDELRRALDVAERRLADADDPSWGLLLARVRELNLEAALCAAAGTNELGVLARERFGARHPGIARAASELCAVWLKESATMPCDERVLSDHPGPRSLLSRMRNAIGKLRLPFVVVAEPSLAPLAATGDRVILVATGRLVCEEDSARTVLHEVEGHARPRARSQVAQLPLLRAGTAGGVDDQEGRALLLEERAGMLGPRRKRQLAARYRAVEAMFDGASFADVAAMLVGTYDFDPADAVLIAERAFRGGDGRRPGLGRERVYLQSFLRVRAHLGTHPEDEDLMAGGQVGVDACEILRNQAVA